MNAAAALEDGTELASVTPGPFLPSREMLGYMMLELGRPADALQQFKATLIKEPNRFWSLCGAGKAATLAGDRQAARGFFQQLVAIAGNAVTPEREELAETRTAVRQ